MKEKLGLRTRGVSFVSIIRLQQLGREEREAVLSHSYSETFLSSLLSAPSYPFRPVWTNINQFCYVSLFLLCEFPVYVCIT